MGNNSIDKIFIAKDEINPAVAQDVAKFLSAECKKPYDLCLLSAITHPEESAVIYAIAIKPELLYSKNGSEEALK